MDSRPPKDDEFVGPFPTWRNAKDEPYNAQGNGDADDTVALQSLFNAVSDPSGGGSRVAYLPRGTYRISGPLFLSARIHFSIIGEDPLNTIIQWGPGGPPSPYPMLRLEGVAYARVNRITWDGSGIARAAIDSQRQSLTQGFFDSNNEFADSVFRNVKYGIYGGFGGFAFAEVSIIRNEFLSCSEVGVALGNANALDVWVRHCRFRDCKVGVSNQRADGVGAGAFRVYDSVFENSAEADLKINNTGVLSVRDNTSVGSKKFFVGGNSRNSCPLVMQGNRVLDSDDTATIRVQNQGPLLLLDNKIRSLTQGKVIEALGETSEEGDCSVIATGNQFTVSGNPIQTGGDSSYLLAWNNTQADLSTLVAQELPGPRPNRGRAWSRALADAIGIQYAIDQAQGQNGSRPVVYLPYRQEGYRINQTIVIPAGTDVQLVGDGNGLVGDSEDWHAFPTRLYRAPGFDGPMIQIKGPTKATIRDLLIDGHDGSASTGTGLLVEGVDQPDARLWFDQCLLTYSRMHNVFVNGLDYARVLFQDAGLGGGGGSLAERFPSVRVVGGLGLAAGHVGHPYTARTIIYSSGQSQARIAHQVEEGGRLLIRDTWYETDEFDRRRRDIFLAALGRASVVVESCNVGIELDDSLEGDEGEPLYPVIRAEGLRGRLTMLGSSLSYNKTLRIRSVGSETQYLGLGNVTSDPEGRTSYIEIDPTGLPGADVRYYGERRSAAPLPEPLRGQSDQRQDVGPLPSADGYAYLESALASTRGVNNETLVPLASGVTDLRLFGVSIGRCNVGLEIKP